MLRMSEVIGDKETRERFGTLLQKAVKVLDEKLWNGVLKKFSVSA